MTVRVKVTVRRAGVNAMARADFMRREVTRRAELVRATAQQIAPVRTGAYRAAIHTTSGTRASGAYARITAGMPYSIYVERGNSLGAPAQRCMARALPVARG